MVKKDDRIDEKNTPPEPNPLPEVFPNRPPPVLEVAVAPKPVPVFEEPKPEETKVVNAMNSTCDARSRGNNAPKE